MKAQISLDLMLTIAVALVAVGSAAALGQNILEMQSDASVKAQLESIGTGLAEIISVSAVLGDADDAKAEYEIPALHVPGEKNPQTCSISLAGTNLTLSYELADLETGASRTITVSKKVIDPGMNITMGNCGETMVIKT